MLEREIDFFFFQSQGFFYVSTRWTNFCLQEEAEEIGFVEIVSAPVHCDCMWICLSFQLSVPLFLHEAFNQRRSNRTGEVRRWGRTTRVKRSWWIVVQKNLKICCRKCRLLEKEDGLESRRDPKMTTLNRTRSKECKSHRVGWGCCWVVRKKLANSCTKYVRQRNSSTNT